MGLVAPAIKRFLRKFHIGCNLFHPITGLSTYTTKVALPFIELTLKPLENSTLNLQIVKLAYTACLTDWFEVVLQISMMSCDIDEK